MNILIYIHIYIYIYVYIYLYIRIYTYYDTICTYVSHVGGGGIVEACANMLTHTHTHIRTYTCTHINQFTYTYPAEDERHMATMFGASRASAAKHSRRVHTSHTHDRGDASRSREAASPDPPLRQAAMGCRCVHIVKRLIS